MRAGVYTVSAWYLRASGNIAGAHCECVAGLSETCQHVAGLLFAVADKGAVPDENKPSCTDLPCKWIVPSEAKKPALKLPLQEIPFHRNVINKPPCLKQPRNYNPSQKVTRYEDIVKLKTRLVSACPTLHAVRYMCPTESDLATKAAAAYVPLEIGDEDDLWNSHASEVLDLHYESLKAVSSAERQLICTRTLGQATNKNWFIERTGRLTASLFKRVCRVTKTEGLLRTILYPNDKAISEAMAYGRTHEDCAVQSYVLLMKARGYNVEVKNTGLHVHEEYGFLAASPDRIVKIDQEEGLLEVKCPFSKIGMTTETACEDPRFCCKKVGGEVVLKKDHAYYFQVQGQMAVTGHKWCDFAIWTENSQPGMPANIHVQRVSFDEFFWQQDMLPALLHFVKHALIPEMVTKRVKRLGKLYTCGQYVSYKKLQQGFYVCSPVDESLTLKIRKLK
ncbi:uncharacterized protein LOC125940379 [Dermacentor silvarum]|uniref:uncharacterized protein LOC125940379 n=1 Tax=Dermacentor silvarum TaxID=543639 RepID=UPI00210167DC|nr:uncharacterized protein LOC125940379 [Dermacentor silvarum]